MDPRNHSSDPLVSLSSRSHSSSETFHLLWPRLAPHPQHDLSKHPSPFANAADNHPPLSLEPSSPSSPPSPPLRANLLSHRNLPPRQSISVPSLTHLFATRLYTIIPESPSSPSTSSSTYSSPTQPYGVPHPNPNT
ncbi:hypothetical protein JAAARDRAFT_40577 [Jaapia argillacea MUCL 33604]|uniref:Uncharacterized protein n=1 Tax=Jaapia argillacea MUCL 33604 TaxID=933084 RepID=A0A067PDS3_9AGAM|nr:hypothetical protein JAAARDRAFT_40577 [Jaapia argillacea MUCL 33604]